MKRFTLDDQDRFARLSGDYNPLHLDPLYSRRLLFGEVVVHGVHIVLWSLEQLLASLPKPVVLEELKATFRTPLALETPLGIESIEVEAGRFVIRSTGNHCELSGRFDETADVAFWSAGLPSHPPNPASQDTCQEMSFEEAAEAEGRIPLFLDPEELRRIFPKVAEKLPALQVAGILATTRLTGMQCPGRRSVFHALDLHFAKNSQPTQLHYRACRSDKRFSVLYLAVKSLGMEGELLTFLRPGPVCQPSFDETLQHVQGGEFQQQRALIVGGSRGLGEVTAKIVAAGGASLRISYHVGKTEAEQLTDELSGRDVDCRYFRLDVTGKSLDSLSEALGDWKPTHLYYFATPHIARGDTPTPFAGAKFRQYCRFYVDGFASVLEALDLDRESSLTVFYPSTVLVDQFAPGTAEYVAAKTAGEALCRHFQSRFPSTSFHAVRLPRLHTDQTASISPQPVEDPLEAMLREIRRLEGARQAPH